MALSVGSVQRWLIIGLTFGMALIHTCSWITQYNQLYHRHPPKKHDFYWTEYTAVRYSYNYFNENGFAYDNVLYTR